MKRQSKVVPDPVKVMEFKDYLTDLSLRTKKGKISFSRIFKDNHINSPRKGFTIAEMAAAHNALFEPTENDVSGVPSMQSKNSLKCRIKYATKKHDPFLELYSTPCINENTRKRENRYHITEDFEDSKKQTDPMFTIAQAIKLSAEKRLNNVLKDPVERMRKVELLDEWFDRDDRTK